MHAIPYPQRAPLASQQRLQTAQPYLHWFVGDLIWRNDLLKNQWSNREDIRHRMLEWNPDIAGAYEQWIYPVIASRPRIRPAHQDDRDEAEQQADELTDHFRTGSGYRDIVHQLSKGGPWWGHVVLELSGSLGLGNVTQGENLIPRCVRIHHERLRFDANDGVARILTDADWVEGVRIDSAKDRYRYIQAQWGTPEGINPYGLGIAERIYWAWHFLSFGRKAWLTALERWGMPSLDVEVTAAEFETHRDRWKDLINDFQATGGVIRPADSGTVEVLNHSASGFPAYEKLDETFRAAIYRAITGETLTHEPGNVGSLALGRVHSEMLTERQWMLVGWVQDVLTETLVKYASEYLYGKDHGFQLEIEFSDPKDAQQQATRLQSARDAGIAVLKDEVYQSTEFTRPPQDTPPEDLHVFPAPTEGGMGMLGGGPGFPAVSAFAERTGIVDARNERRRDREIEALGVGGVVAAAKALTDLVEGRIKERAPLAPGEDLPPSEPPSS